MKKSFLFVGLFVPLFAVVSCKSPSSPETPKATVASVSVTSANSSIQVGQTEQMTATITMSDGSTKGATGTWGSDNMDVASVDQSGLVTAVSAGTATIYIDVNASALVSASAANSAAAVTSSGSQTGGQGAGKNRGAKAGLRGQKWGGKKGAARNNKAALEKEIETESSSETTEKVKPTGTVRGSKSLTVEAPTVVRVDVTSPHSTIIVDQTEQMTATVTMSDGSTKPGVGTWISGNESVATVNQSGVVRGIGPGGVDIKFKNSAGKQGLKTMKVRNVWSRSGTGDNVFDMPTYVERVRVVGTYTGNSSNFIVYVGGHLLVNELLGTFWGQTRYDGTLLTTGGVVEIQYSSGVSWSFTEVPVTTALTGNERRMPVFSGKSIANNREYQIYLREDAKKDR